MIKVIITAICLAVKKHKRSIVILLICILLCVAVYFGYSAYLQGDIHISDSVLNSIDLGKIVENYHKLSESGEYNIWELSDKEYDVLLLPGENSVVTIRNMDQEKVSVIMYIYPNVHEDMPVNDFVYTARYRRTDIWNAIYGLYPLGTCYASFVLDSNYVAFKITDYESNARAISLEHEISKIMSIINGDSKSVK